MTIAAKPKVDANLAERFITHLPEIPIDEQAALQEWTELLVLERLTGALLDLLTLLVHILEMTSDNYRPKQRKNKCGSQLDH